jgi:Ca2+-binding RTX toxin-like protein
MAAIDYIDTVQGVYLAYYGRFADKAGLNYWTSALNANGGNLNVIINAFGTSAEATALYPTTLTNAAKINMVYQTLFGRDADTAGSTYYQGLISSGAATLVDIAKRVLDGATAQDRMAISNKIVVADQLTEAVGTQATYTGAAVITAARTLMSGVTSDATTKTTALNNAATTINTAAGTTTTTTTTATDTTAPTITELKATTAGTTVSLTSNEAGYYGFYLNGQNVVLDTNSPSGVVALTANTASTLAVSEKAAITIYDVIAYDNAGNATVSTQKVIVGASTNASDTITGTNANDIIFGLGGNDGLTGGQGADTFVINSGADTIADLGIGGTDNIILTAAATSVTATATATWTASSDTVNNKSLAGGIIDAKGQTVTLTNAGGTFGWTLKNTSATGSAITGSGKDDIISGSTTDASVDTLVGGAGNDIFDYTATANVVSGGAFIDSITGGDGTADAIRITTATGVTIASGDSWARVATVESITAGSSAGVISITVNDNVTAAGITTIDLSGDTDSTGNNVIDLSNDTTGSIITTVKGSAGADTITGNAAAQTITGGEGADTITGGAGNDTIDLTETTPVVDTVKFSAAANNGTDTILSFTAGASKDVLNVSGLATLVGTGANDGNTSAKAVYVGATNGGTKGDTAVSKVVAIGADDNADSNWTNVVSKIGGALTVAADTTAGNANTVVLISNGTDTRVYLFSDDATSNTTVEASELTLVATLTGVTTGSFDYTNFALA